ncbi:unnamed protein product [Larinioides sclopetarius]|uniref:Uncharacterized protein n=1 Tax=Larinioides sclopetarius TaxID=280406 RepID=A0AAV2AKP7_9ARAC
MVDHNENPDAENPQSRQTRRKRSRVTPPDVVPHIEEPDVVPRLIDRFWSWKSVFLAGLLIVTVILLTIWCLNGQNFKSGSIHMFSLKTSGKT